MSIGTGNSWDTNAMQSIMNNYADFAKTDRIRDRASDIAANRGTFVLNQDEYNNGHLWQYGRLRYGNLSILNQRP